MSSIEQPALTLAQRAVLAALLGALFAGLAAIVYVALTVHDHRPPPVPDPPPVHVINA